MKGMSKRAMSAALSVVMGITTTAALPVSAMAEEKEYTAKELHVAIWDNNQLDGLLDPAGGGCDGRRIA